MNLQILTRLFKNVQILSSCELTGLPLEGMGSIGWLWPKRLQRILLGVSKCFEEGGRLWAAVTIKGQQGPWSYVEGFWVAGDIQSSSRQTLSPPQRPLCVVGRLGRKKRERAFYFFDNWYFDGVTQREPLWRRERQTHWRYLYLIYHFAGLFTSDMS